MVIPCNTEGFFEFMAERESIRLKKEAGEPWPWTEDKILQTYKFTNVFREADATTVWFRENVRDPLRDYSELVFFATVAFRWFNKIETGKLLLPYLLGKEKWNMAVLYPKLLPHKPWVNGAYIIKTPDGMDKLMGVLTVIENVHTDKTWFYDGIDDQLDPNLEFLHKELQDFPYMGPFMAYEVVTDLRHTCILEHAPDIMTWANAGPGAKRGIYRIFNKDVRPRDMNGIMQDLLKLGQKVASISWYAPLEMREIEHTLCEFDKYQRTALGEGQPKQKYIVEKH